jgi:hypothetical protein
MFDDFRMARRGSTQRINVSKNVQKKISDETSSINESAQDAALE